MVRKLFGTDGIRGKVNSFPIIPETLVKIGISAGIFSCKKGSKNRVIIGKDTRISGYMIESSLVSGLTYSGVEVFLLGTIPTPAVSTLCRSLRANMGLMISASHNPFYDNGIKFFDSNGYKLSENFENKIENLFRKKRTSLCNDEDHNPGKIKYIDHGIHRYIEFIKNTIPHYITLKGLRIVVDCANGAAYKSLPIALWELGADVVVINNTPSGININKNCGSIFPNEMAKKVQEENADIGISLDGDGDRITMADHNGSIIDGDQLIATIAYFWNKKGQLKGGGIVTTVMSNLGLERFLENHSIFVKRTKVGDRNVLEKMLFYGFNVGGEKSGHIILSNFGSTSDGLVIALQILYFMQETNLPINKLCCRFELIPQILKNIKITSFQSLKSQKIKKIINESKKILGKKGRIIIRPSGTEPVIRVMAEGDNEDLITNLVDNVINAIDSYQE